MMEDTRQLSEVDPEIAPLLAALPSGPTFEPDLLNSFRKNYEENGIPAIQRKVEPDLPSSSDYTVHDHHIDVGGVTVLARSIVPTPLDGEDTFPLLFWIHGGGWMLGDVHLDDYQLRITSVKLRIAIVNCEYRLAPEHPFPTAVNDLTAALKHVVSHPEKFSASLEKGFIIGGQSAGGNLAAVLTSIARDDPFFKDKSLTGQLLHVPATVHYQAYPEKYKESLLSFEQNKDAPVLNQEDMITAWKMYNGPPTDPRVSPLLLSSHQGLPPAFVQVSGLDVLRDEGILYERALREAGVLTKLEVYPGVPHGFEGALFFYDIKQAVKFREDTRKGLKWLLESGRRSEKP
ncbi:hypothetical protein V5O48_004961 [Marasmius crinis-equi]|uniref:Alpha/beta hydrolase fold-3 domain-containing protein n=1 Tax=Marasmius crinis-equi TaxID=585013 RepID=A0ABR3FP41_9AGAR